MNQTVIVVGLGEAAGPPTSQAAVVTMSIDPNGLPIHADATAKIRPRIFLEGNFYVDLRPGSPNAPTLASGRTLAAASTSGPVQLDRVLAALNSNARANLETPLPLVDLVNESLEKLANDLPVVIFTTSHSARDIARCYELGANSYVSKPGNLGQFFSAVRSIENFWFGFASIPN